MIVGNILFQNANPNSVYGKLWKKVKFAGAHQRFNHVMFGEEPAVSMGDRSGMESRAIDSGLCNWGLLKEKFLPAYFGIALPKDSPYTSAFSFA